MTTKLDTQLKRELIVLGEPYTLVISANGLALTPKGKRRGYELAWADLVSGDAALAVALNASLAHGPKPESAHPKPVQAKVQAKPARTKQAQAKPRNAKSRAGKRASTKLPD